ncbi:MULTISPECIES: HpcH/HpaI aldolase/citrate lyase family protein [unclassified Acinetobacter]|uniref:HpcH/HpaI aldolase/citrate lyase family protein n=1 Tax=unclassified Acinetobacter TaxID=196816 RepID=UPI0035BB6986
MPQPLDAPTPLHALELGATLYVPATRLDLVDITLNNKINGLRSMVLCLEDAVSEHDVAFALKNLAELLMQLSEQPKAKLKIFIRPRHHAMLQSLLSWQNIGVIDGFVLPKFDTQSLPKYQQILQHNQSLYIMPTFESADIFDIFAQRDIRQALQQDFSQVLALRIGGNDLLNTMSLRRPTTHHIYATPVGYLIAQLAGQFISHGFAMTAPVFEHFSQVDLFQQELALDIEHGLSGKTVIHPSQIAMVHDAFKVSQSEFEQAQAILQPDAQAVFAVAGSMIEPATHKNWAEKVLLRAEVYGVR